MVLLLGDMNAQVDSNRQGLEHVIGPHGSAQQTNDNGERLLMFCNSNGICIGNTYFKHKLIHKRTWRSPDGTVKNEIDYICINQRLISTLRDVRVYRGADIGSDHQLVIVPLKLKLKKILRLRSLIISKSLKTKKLGENSNWRYKIDLVYLQHYPDVEEQWSMFKDAITTTAEQKIGRRRGSKRNSWIQDRAWLISGRKQNQRKTKHDQQK